MALLPSREGLPNKQKIKKLTQLRTVNGNQTHLKTHTHTQLNKTCVRKPIFASDELSTEGGREQSRSPVPDSSPRRAFGISWGQKTSGTGTMSVSTADAGNTMLVSIVGAGIPLRHPGERSLWILELGLEHDVD